jgi:hypothetical protein
MGIMIYEIQQPTWHVPLGIESGDLFSETAEDFTSQN